MSGMLHLTITTPSAVLVDRSDIVSLRAEDESGAFGILRGHADFLTALPPSVVRFRDGADRLHYCVVREGILSVAAGRRVAIACRQGTVGTDLGRLEADVAALRATQIDEARRARVEQLRLHADAVRQLMGYLRPTRADGEAAQAVADEAMP